MEHPNEKASDPSADNSASELDWKQQAEVLEKRRRDTQSLLTPLQQENAKLRAEIEVLQESIGNVTLTLDSETQDKLDTLKYEDPDKWRNEINKLEKSAHKQAKDEMETKVKEKAAEHLTAEEKEVNRKLAVQFFKENTDLDANTFHKLIPVGLQEDAIAGKISVAELLEQGAALIRNAPVKSAKAPKSPDLGSVAGAANPSKQAKEKQANKDWQHAMV